MRNARDSAASGVPAIARLRHACDACGRLSPGRRRLSMPRLPLRIRAGARLLACLALGLTLVPASARPLTLPPGFVDEPLPFTFVYPTSVRFLPDGRPLITEKRGRLYMIDTDGTLRLLWSSEATVLDYADRGLIGLAVDP